MADLVYHRPRTVAEAVEQLSLVDARALAGGTDLIPQLREGRRHVSAVVDIKLIPEVSAVSELSDGSLHVGAAASVRQLGRDARFAGRYPSLLAAARLIGSLQIQSRASLGGNLCNGTPSADASPMLYALGASLEIEGPTGRRTVAADGFVTAPGKTSLGPGELLVAITLPPVHPRQAACYLRFTPRREMDIAIAGAAAVVELGEGGDIEHAHIVLASVAPVPLVASAAGAILIGARPGRDVFKAAGERAAAEARPISDTRGSADYRRELVAVLTRRALETCAADLGLDIA